MICFFAGNVGTYGGSERVEIKISEISGNRLLSFAYRKQEAKSFDFWLDEKKVSGKRLFFDCGAFTARAKGIEIDLDEYIEYVKENREKFFCCASLDKIGDAKQSRKNHEYMKGKGIDSIPTFHLGSDFKELERYCKDDDYIAIGKIIPLLRDKDKLFRLMDHCWSIIKKYWPIKIHAFGVIAPYVLSKYPFYSCDSSSAILSGGFGRIMSFNGTTLKGESWKDTEKTGKHGCLIDSSGSKYFERRVHNVREVVKLERYITRLWAKRGIEWTE